MCFDFRNRAVILSLVLLFGSGCTKNKEAAQSTKNTTTSVATELGVATLREAKSPVELRKRNDLHWDTAILGAELFNRDTLRTGEGGSGLVEFHDSSLIKISENSTVTIQDHTQRDGLSKTVVALPKGVVTGDLDSNREKVELTLKTRKGWLKVKNYNAAGARVKGQVKAVVLPSGETKLDVVLGDATFVTKDGEKNLSVGERVAITANPEEKSGTEEERFDSLPEAKSEGVIVKKIPEDEMQVLVKEMAVIAEAHAAMAPVVSTTTSSTSTSTTTSTTLVQTPSSSTTNPKVKKENVTDGPPRFEILSPKGKSKTEDASVNLKIKNSGPLKVVLNGTEINLSDEGITNITVNLNLGLNLLVFQIINLKTEQITYQNFEITRTK